MQTVLRVISGEKQVEETKEMSAERAFGGRPPDLGERVSALESRVEELFRSQGRIEKAVENGVEDVKEALLDLREDTKQSRGELARHLTGMIVNLQHDLRQQALDLADLRKEQIEAAEREKQRSRITHAFMTAVGGALGTIATLVSEWLARGSH